MKTIEDMNRLIGTLPVPLPEGPYMEATPPPVQRQEADFPPWLSGAHQFAMQQFLKAFAERQREPQVPSWQMPYPMQATAGERQVLSMMPIAGDVEDVRYLMEGVHEGDPAKAAMGGAAAMMPFMPASLLHTVYHGSPHIFDAFKMSKIGTGEGAQAYGHGLYFAESPGVAHGYRKTLSQGRTVVRGQPIESLPRNEQIAALDLAALQQQLGGDKERALRYRLEEVGGYVDKAKQNLDEAIAKQGTVEDTGEDWGDLRYFEWTPEHVEQQRQAVRNTQEQYDFLRSLEPEDVGETPGAFYEVEIPDEAVGRMLDWDKPLSEQPWLAEGTKGEIIARVKAEGRKPTVAEVARVNLESPHYGDPSGRVFYNDLAQRLGSKEAASEALRQAGIPGIRYFDAMSRGAEEGTRNLVLFDESLATIMERQ